VADTEDLVLSISADVRQMQRALARITGDTAKTTAVLQKQFNDLGTQTSASFDRTAANANRAFTVIEGGARRAGAAMNASRLQTGNLAAQLNDIGVQLAGGQSPFLIAIQQGSQINQVLGQSGVRGAVSLLGGAFASLINPVSLATFAIIALGGTAINYFAELISGGEDSEKTLKQQAELIRDVARQWGDALPALRAYADERQRIEDEASRGVATDTAVDQLLAKVREVVPQVAEEIFRLNTALLQTGDAGPIIDELESAFSNLETKVADGTAQADDLKRVQDALASAFVSTGIPAAQAMADILAGLAAQYGATADQAARLNAEEAAAAARGGAGYSDVKGGRGADPRTFVNDQYYNNRYFPDPAEMARPRRGGGGSGGRGGGASEAEREAEAVRKLIEQLQFEYDLLGATEEERAVANALRRAGASATEEQKAKIEELILATEREKEALQASEEAMKVFQDIGKDFLSGFISDLKAGKSASEALANALSRLGDRLLDLALNSLFSVGGVGGFLSGLFKNAKGNAFDAGHVTPFARGGVVSRPTVFPMAKGMGLMGEAGPEAVMPLARDYMGRLGVRSQGGGERQELIIVSRFDADGGFESAVERTSRPIARMESVTAAGKAVSAIPSVAEKTRMDGWRKLRPQSVGR
jgi:hypothetical protein